jgi:hypothetical protein
VPQARIARCSGNHSHSFLLNYSKFFLLILSNIFEKRSGIIVKRFSQKMIVQRIYLSFFAPY